MVELLGGQGDRGVHVRKAIDQAGFHHTHVVINLANAIGTEGILWVELGDVLC